MEVFENRFLQRGFWRERSPVGGAFQHALDQLIAVVPRSGQWEKKVSEILDIRVWPEALPELAVEKP